MPSEEAWDGPCALTTELSEGSHWALPASVAELWDFSMMRRAAIVLALVALLVAGTLYGIVAIVLPPAIPAALPAQVAPEEALTEHLLLLVVDGLRFDVATDPKRMPLFSNAMERHSSGEIWAGRVSMTTSAVLTYGTGQRGSLEQIVRNVNPNAPVFNSWLSNAREAGRTLAAVGDPAWPEMYGEALAFSRVDPKGVAIDVDFNPQTFRDSREAVARRPNFLVAHFVTPDHQAHTHGVPSVRYRQHIADFDRKLHAFLEELGPEWTVIVTSDHGAADSGTHGADVPIQRRSPIYAYGPGIQPDVHPAHALDQADLGGTMAALLGVSGPAHSRGHLLVNWLALPPAARAKLACSDAQRALAYGEATFGEAALRTTRAELVACREGHPEAQVSAARGIVAAVDAEVAATTGLSSRRAYGVAALVFLSALGISLLIGGRRVLAALPAASAVGLLSIVLLFYVERLPGAGPNLARAGLFAGANMLLLSVLLVPRLVSGWLDRHPALAPALIPGLLVASYTTNVHPEGYVAVVICSLVFLLGGLNDTAQGRPRRRFTAVLRGWRSSQWSMLGLLVISLAFLFPAGTRADRVYPGWLVDHPERVLWASLASIVIWAASRNLISKGRSNAPGRRYGRLLGGLLLIIGSLLWRRVASPEVGRLFIIALALAMALAARRGHKNLALIFGVAAFAWVSRDFEMIALVFSLMVAEIVGIALAGASDDTQGWRLGRHLLFASMVFGLFFVQRVGLQGSIDFGSMDWGVAGFGDPHVSQGVVAAALTWKYLLAELLILGLLGWQLRPSVRTRALRGLVIMYLARLVMLVLMLFSCGGSFWTALRVLGDLPHAMVAALACGLAWLSAEVVARRSGARALGTQAERCES